jgi:hypothetical protein
MPYELKAGKSIGRGGKNPLAFFILAMIYTLSIILLPFTVDRQTAHIAPRTVLAKDSDGDHGGSGDESSGENDGGDSGESSGDNDGNGGSDDGKGGEADEDNGGGGIGEDHEDNSNNDANDGNEFDLDEKDGGRDRRSENENHQGNRQDGGRFDFGDFDDLQPMTAQEEADVVGNWDQ